MASSRTDAPRTGLGRFAVGVWLRALAISLLGFAAIQAGLAHLYATAVVLVAAGAGVALDLARASGAADRMMAQLVDGLMAGGYERPAAAAGAPRLSRAIEAALGRMGEARLRTQQRADFAEALADNVVASLLVVDDGGSLVHVNRAGRALLGEHHGPLDRAPALGPLAARRLIALRPGGRDVLRLADGRSVLVSMTGFAVPGGPPLRLYALQGLSSELDVVVLKAWQDLVRVLAHEMMNSLTPICSLSDSIAERLREPRADGVAPGPLEVEVTEAVEVIARRSTGLMSFVERYRQVSDLPALAPAAFALADFVRDLDALMTPLMAAAGVTYASSVEPAGLRLNADAELLAQATINLLKNALDAVAGRPGAAVRLVCRQAEDAVSIAVEDNGPGLARLDAEAAFTPFFTTKAGGSGIGLTLARQIALAHDGRIDYAPDERGGAVFRLTLPHESQD